MAASVGSSLLSWRSSQAETNWNGHPSGFSQEAGLIPAHEMDVAWLNQTPRGPALGLGCRCVHKAGPRGAQHHQHEASPARKGPGGQSGSQEHVFSPRCTEEPLNMEGKYQNLPFFCLFAFLKVVRVRFIYSGTPLGRQGRLHLPVQS